MSFTAYLSGEIHTDWRDEIKRGAQAAGLDVIFTSAVTDHEASDAAGDCLGAEPNAFWRDHKSSKVNAIRTKTLIQQADLVVVRFGDKYKQWNAAFDAGYCTALNKALHHSARRRHRAPPEGSRCSRHGLGDHYRAGGRDSEVCAARLKKSQLSRRTYSLFATRARLPRKRRGD